MSTEALTDQINAAHQDFRDAFELALHNAELDANARAYLDEVFRRTVQHAIENGHDWRKGTDATDFALRSVGEIAVVARYATAGEFVTLSILQYAEQRVIRYWKPRCEQVLGIPPRLQFCVTYDDEGRPTTAQARSA